MRAYDYESSIGFLVNRTAKSFCKALDSELRSTVGVTFGQWKVIAALAVQNGLTQKEIADRLGIEGPTLIPIIDKMEEEKLLIRKADLDDRRINRIYLTDKVHVIWDEMLECALRIRKISIKDIPDEQVKIMRQVLEKMSLNLMDHFNTNSDRLATPISKGKGIKEHS